MASTFLIFAIGLTLWNFLLSVAVWRSSAAGFRQKMLSIYDEELAKFWQRAGADSAIRNQITEFQTTSDRHEDRIKSLQGQINQAKSVQKRASNNKAQDEAEEWAEMMGRYKEETTKTEPTNSQG